MSDLMAVLLVTALCLLVISVTIVRKLTGRSLVVSYSDCDLAKNRGSHP